MELSSSLCKPRYSARNIDVELHYNTGPVMSLLRSSDSLLACPAKPKDVCGILRVITSSMLRGAWLRCITRPLQR
jgi:hypothetical protein